MSERKSREYLDRLKKKYKVDVLWSWSRYDTYTSDPYGYYLKYILKEKETKTNIYSVSGGNCHDIIQDFYDKKIKYEDMIEIYEDKLLEMNLAELKYDRNNKEKNEIIAKKYEDNVRLFFNQHIPILHKTITEQFVVIKVGKHIFQGYIDFIYRDNEGKYNIIDWKTSSIYKGKDIDKKSGQLILYAEALMQKGIPIENIKIGWNFLKYCSVQYDLAGIDKETGKNKTKIINPLRTEWILKIKGNLKTWLKREGYDDLEIEDMIQTAIENDNLNNIPKEIRDRYKKSDCFVYIPLNKDIIDNLKDNIIKTIEEIEQKERDYNDIMENIKDNYDEYTEAERNSLKDEAEHLFWTTINEENNYFFSTLSGYSSKQHKPYKEFLDNIYSKKDIEIKETIKLNEDDDDDWLNNLDD